MIGAPELSDWAALFEVKIKSYNGNCEFSNSIGKSRPKDQMNDYANLALRIYLSTLILLRVLRAVPNLFPRGCLIKQWVGHCNLIAYSARPWLIIVINGVDLSVRLSLWMNNVVGFVASLNNCYYQTSAKSGHHFSTPSLKLSFLANAAAQRWILE